MKTFYLSSVIRQNIYSTPDHSIGILLDLIVDINSPRPKVVAANVLSNEVVRCLDLTKHRIIAVKGKVRFQVNNIRDFDPSSIQGIYLVRHLQDKQVVDITGRKVVKVNDLRLVNVNSGTFLIAVDVGFKGMLRQVGLDKFVGRIYKLFNKTLTSELILWDEVEAINYDDMGIQLSKPYQKLSKLHPSDLADILEDLDSKALMDVFSSLDEEQAADVLEEMEPQAQRNVLENMPVDKAADVLEKMPSDEVADILDELESDKAEELLSEMETESSDEVRELMEYPDNQVGSLMSTDFVALHELMTVEETFTELRRLQPEANTIYSLYILDKSERLVATLSLRDLVLADTKAQLIDIMNHQIIFVYDDDNINILSEIIAKYNLSAVSVVDHDMTMLGMVIIDDVVFNLLRRLGSKR
jgi:magnesium transporter